ncbi:MAG: hypothetical protein WAV16_02400 [Candidatus Moraniibacteriota bacterium]
MEKPQITLEGKPTTLQVGDILVFEKRSYCIVFFRPGQGSLYTKDNDNKRFLGENLSLLTEDSIAELIGIVSGLNIKMIKADNYPGDTAYEFC